MSGMIWFALASPGCQEREESEKFKICLQPRRIWTSNLLTHSNTNLALEVFKYALLIFIIQIQ